jgi:hypothetical protein
VKGGISQRLAPFALFLIISLGLMILATTVLQEAATSQANASTGTGLEWLTVGSVVIPAVLLVVLVYWGARETV